MTWRTLLMDAVLVLGALWLLAALVVEVAG